MNLWTGAGYPKTEIFADILNGSPLRGQPSMTAKWRTTELLLLRHVRAGLLQRQAQQREGTLPDGHGRGAADGAAAC